MKLIATSIQFVADSAVDVLPIAVFLFAFQRLIIGGPMPNRKQIVVGLQDFTVLHADATLSPNLKQNK